MTKKLAELKATDQAIYGYVLAATGQGIAPLTIAHTIAANYAGQRLVGPWLARLVADAAVEALSL